MQQYANLGLWVGGWGGAPRTLTTHRSRLTTPSITYLLMHLQLSTHFTHIFFKTSSGLSNSQPFNTSSLSRLHFYSQRLSTSYSTCVFFPLSPPTLCQILLGLSLLLNRQIIAGEGGSERSASVSIDPLSKLESEAEREA